MDNITEYLKKAFEYKKEGDYKSALDYFYKALTVDNDSEEIMSELAYLYSKLCRYERACALYEQILAKNPNNLQVKFNYALLLKKQKDIKKAENILADLINSDYEVVKTCEELFPILSSEKKFEQIIQYYNKLENKNSSSVIIYFAALAYQNTGNFNKAEELFLNAFSVDENNINAGYNIAVILYEKELYEECAALINKLLKYSEDDRLFYLMAEILYSKKDLDGALKYYSYAINNNAKEAEYYYKLGVVFSLKGYFNEAEQSFCKAITIDNNNLLYNYTLAYLYYTNNKKLLAEKTADFILSLDSENLNGLSLKLILLAENNDIVSASKIEEKINKADNRDDFSYYAQSKYYEKLNMYEKSIKCIKKALEINQNSTEYKYTLAKNYYCIKNYDKALKIGEEIISQNDKYIQAYILSGLIYLEKGDNEKAQLYADEAYKLDINSNEVYYIRGKIKYSQKQYEKAAQDFKTALSIAPNSEEYYHLTAQSLYNAEKYEEAYLYYKEASQLDISNAQYRYYMAKCAIQSEDEDNVISNFSLMKRLAPDNINYIEEYAKYLAEKGKIKPAISLLKSLLKGEITEENKTKIKKDIEKIKKRC